MKRKHRKTSSCVLKQILNVAKHGGKEFGFDGIYKDIFINQFEFRILTNLENLRDTVSSEKKLFG